MIWRRNYRHTEKCIISFIDMFPHSLFSFFFIRSNKFADALKITGILLQDKEDLIYRAAGWMLREVGKRDIKYAELFLQKHCPVMPRAMLRYVIERFTPAKRRIYMDG